MKFSQHRARDLPEALLNPPWLLVSGKKIRKKVLDKPTDREILNPPQGTFWIRADSARQAGMNLKESRSELAEAMDAPGKRLAAKIKKATGGITVTNAAVEPGSNLGGGLVAVNASKKLTSLNAELNPKHLVALAKEDIHISVDGTIIFSVMEDK